MRIQFETAEEVICHINQMKIAEKLSDLNGLECVVAKDFVPVDQFYHTLFPLTSSKVSFSIRGTLEVKSGFYRLNVSTVSFVSFNLEDVNLIQDSRIELK